MGATDPRASSFRAETYAEVSVERKMAESVSAIDELTAMLREKALPAANKVTRW